MAQATSTTSTSKATKGAKGAKGAQVQAPKGVTVQSPFAAAAAQLAARTAVPAPVAAPAPAPAPVPRPVGAAGNSGAVSAVYAPGSIGAQIWAAAQGAATASNCAIVAVRAPQVVAYMLTQAGMHCVNSAGATVPAVTKNGALQPLNLTSLTCGLTHLRTKHRSIAAAAAKQAAQG